MDNLLLVQILQSNNHIGHKKSSLILCKATTLSDMIPEIAAINVIHQQVKILSGLEGADHINNKRVLEFR